jgi:lipid A 3-O-deacylase
MQYGCKLRWRSPATMMALATGIIFALLRQPAIADELVAPRWSGQLLDPHRYELRFGGFAHGVGSIESGQIDINGEFVLPRLPFGRGEWWDFLVPRPHLGVMANLSGGTSYAYAGGLWTIPLPSRFFAEFFFGGALANGTTVGDATHVALGCNPLFHVGGSLGYSLTQNWHVIGTFDHISNGNGVFGTNCDRNQGLNNYGARISYSF